MLASSSQPGTKGERGALRAGQDCGCLDRSRFFGRPTQTPVSSLAVGDAG